MIAHFANRPEYEVHLISHVISRVAPWRTISGSLSNSSAEFPEAVVGPQFENPSAAKSYIATIDFFSDRGWMLHSSRIERGASRANCLIAASSQASLARSASA